MAYTIPETGFSDFRLEGEVIRILNIHVDYELDFQSNIDKMRDIAKFFGGGNADTLHEIRKILMFQQDSDVSALEFLWSHLKIEQEEAQLKEEEKQKAEGEQDNLN